MINKTLAQIISTAFLLISISCTAQQAVRPQPLVAVPFVSTELSIEKLIITPNPDGHRDFIQAIQGAKKSIYLTMFHLTNDEVIQALIQAKKKGVEVKVILDNKSMILDRFENPYKTLLAGGVEAIKSSKKFTITHEKSMTIDHSVAFVTAINLTMNYSTTRDFGIITKDPSVVAEVENVFQADWQNALNNSGTTPELINSNLVWSPVNAAEKIVALIKSAKISIDLQVENLGYQPIQKALIEQAEKKIKVRVLVPLCDKNFNPFHNVKYIQNMQEHQVQTKVMPSPATVEAPYIHSKMILVDGKTVYIGSINFSNNSVLEARELGIVFKNQKVADQIFSEFEKDWNHAILLPEKRSRIQCIRDMKGSL